MVLLPRLQSWLDRLKQDDDKDDGGGTSSHEEAQYCNLNRVVWGFKEDKTREWLRKNWGGVETAGARANGSDDEWLTSWLGPLPPLLIDRCCAQFVVHRDRIRQQPRAFYAAAINQIHAKVHTPTFVHALACMRLRACACVHAPACIRTNTCTHTQYMHIKRTHVGP